ncbi:hypothetical protein B0T17DRAFT_486825 [Bombardia bombarda]|uniref:Uncharacterized protein n=1 Tax=Bombardia bombarda TaxID=252184 RepID=A0AA39X877_9PEZI|nr:hypothetical protein B0T17DRAFT_486825 [Bombardia bombarda]
MSDRWTKSTRHRTHQSLPAKQVLRVHRDLSSHHKQILPVNRPSRNTSPKEGLTSSKRYSASVSQSSNVSKRRSIPVSTRQTTRGSVRSNESESPLTSPLTTQRKVHISHEFTNAMAGVINQFTTQQHSVNNEQKEHYARKAQCLKIRISDAYHTITKNLKQIETQSKEIEELQDAKEQMASQIKSMKAEMDASRDRTKKIEDKYRTVKEHLNNAIDEQQDLYSRTKAQWQEALSELQTREHAHKLALESTLKKTDIMREQMLEKVRQAVAQNKHDARGLYDQINALTEQMEEKDLELNREKIAVQTLSQELENLHATTENYDALAAQNKEILARLKEQKCDINERHKKAEDRPLAKLDAITERLDNLLKLTSSQPEILSNLQSAHHEATISVTSKLKSILESQTTTGESSEQLATDLKAHMEKIWQRLDGQHEVLGQQLRDKLKENETLSTLLRSKELECQHNNIELEQLRTIAGDQEAELRHIQNKLGKEETANAGNEETARQLRRAEAEAQRLTEELMSKRSAVTALEAKLEEKDQRFRTELQQLAENNIKLSQTIAGKDTACKIAVEQATDQAAKEAAEIARREVRFDMEREITETKEFCNQVQQERDFLAEQLRQLKQHVAHKGQAERQNVMTISSLRDVLSEEEKQRASIAEDLKRQSLEFEQTRTQETAKMIALETNLVVARRKAADLEEANRRLSVKEQAFITSLNNLKSSAGLVDVGNGIEEICESNTSSAEELGSNLTQAIQHLMIASQNSQPLSGDNHGRAMLREAENSLLTSNEQRDSDEDENRLVEQAVPNQVANTSAANPHPQQQAISYLQG